MLSTKLETLRDMSPENYIDPAHLTKIKTIGGGSFATGMGSFSCLSLDLNRLMMLALQMDLIKQLGLTPLALALANNNVCC